MIFQEPQPGPLLPKGEHYFTIGWKQVKPFFFYNSYLLIQDATDMACAQTIQETALHLRTPLRVLFVSRCMCTRTLSFKTVTPYLCIGTEHNRDTGFNLSKRQILVQFLAEHLAWPCTGLDINGEYTGILVYPTVFQD